MADQRDRAIEHGRSQIGTFRRQLEDFLRIPSISTDPNHSQDIERAAQWLVSRLEAMGGTAEQLETGGKPLVAGEIPADMDDAPTLLVYGHYDVQPTDPLEQWRSDPFEPTEREGALYARGTSDMKGQIMACLAAIDAAKQVGALPVTCRFLLEGEEEIGSPNLKGAIRGYADRFTGDLCINPDTGMLSKGQPSITYGLRGLAYFEIHVTGPSSDLHSGAFGGAVHNPAQVLSELIAGMHDERGRVTLPGFYERVRDLSETERAQLARLSTDDRFYLEQTGVPALWGEEGYSAIERISGRPTLEVNGLLSGFTGEGAKTVLPATAMAKISTRLVPDQDPEEVRAQLERYLSEHAPDTVSYSITEYASAPPVMNEPESPGNHALASALQAVWGVEPILKREGGTVPVSTFLQEIVGMPSVLTGFALPDDNLHAPNEKIDLDTWQRGIEAVIRFLYDFRDSAQG
jgi:acetylornithine deacetylase/succinyl-diaminopimelate desuccinylase-like protein